MNLIGSCPVRLEGASWHQLATRDTVVHNGFLQRIGTDYTMVYIVHLTCAHGKHLHVECCGLFWM